MTDGAVRLAVRGDDLGMAHAVNTGIAAAWTDGILTQTTAMAPCAWIAEGARVAVELGIPAAVHTTLTAEWTNLRWSPLTGRTTCASSDGTFHRTTQDVAALVGLDDAVAEVDAQVERLRAAGLELAGLDPHMGAVLPGLAKAVSARHGLPFTTGARGGFDGVAMLTDRPDKRSWLMAWLRDLTPGTHLLLCHPGVDGAELAAATDPTEANAPWAHEWRVSDLALLTDPEVRDLVEVLGIELVSAFGDGTAHRVEKP